MIFLTSIVLWPLMFLLQYIVLSILGIPIVGTLSLFKMWQPVKNQLGHSILEWSPRWAYLWGNKDDGVVPPAIVNGVPYLPGKGSRFRAFAWGAFRNKVSNLRFTKPFGFQVDPKKIKWLGNNRNLYNTVPSNAKYPQWSMTWQGLYSGLWVRWRSGKQLRIGWTLIPADADGFDPNNLRQLWCGFSVQLNQG